MTRREAGRAITTEQRCKNGIATQSGDEDDTFAADAPLADAAFGK
jgi:hypothetical protein